MTADKRHCLACNEEIHGRRDKKFCSDHCRATHYNNHNTDIAAFMRRINYTIRKNRNILYHLNPGGRARVHKLKLVDSGLNFDYFTNVYKTRSGKTYYFCYDQGYLELGDEYFALVTRQGDAG
jgi:predicted nucleic acid-binding Zn ribbon protein